MAKKSLPQRGNSRKSIDDMNMAEITAYNVELLARLKQLLSERAPKAQPQAQVEPSAKLPTKRMRKAVTAFDSMTDSEQVDSLRAMW